MKTKTTGLGEGTNEDEESTTKAPPVNIFAWLPVGVKANKPARGSVSLI